MSLTPQDRSLDATLDALGEFTRPENPRGGIELGQRVADTYRIDGVLGSGGMGTVYLAFDENLGREVAIKVIHAELLAEPRVRDAFLAEARAMARVRHPNVATVHAFGLHEQRPYLVMEHVRGTNLARWMARPERGDLGEAVAMLDALCRGVHAIHLTGALHRDIKPSNILVAEDGRVAVTDFGLATPPGSIEDAAPFGFGTPAYVAPEVARVEPILPEFAKRIDVYALALVAFELLTGRRPFGPTTVMAMMQDHAETPPPSPSSLCSTLPRAFDAPLLRALAKAPANRTPSVEAFRCELQRAYQAVEEFPRGLKILSVDDEINTLVAVRELLLLEFPTAEVISVANASTAIQIAFRERPDVVITDYEMPGGGAPLLTAALRGDSRTADVPIIVVTGRGGAKEWSELQALGADRFLVKPIDFEALSAMIRAFLRTARPRP